MTRKDTGTRHSSTASSKSTDTLRALPPSGSLFKNQSRSRTPIQVPTDGRERFDDPEESQISPTSGGPHIDHSTASFSSNAYPRENLMSNFGNYRRDLAVLDTSGGRIPQIQHNPPTAQSPENIAPWMSPNGSVKPSSAFSSSFYNDSSDNLSEGSQLSPGFRPGTGLTGNTASSDAPDPAFSEDARRPSVASITTASSTGSKSSVARNANMHKKLQGFFGEEFPGKDSSETSLPASTSGKEHRSNSYSRHRERNHSASTATGVRDSSPTPSRPRTPVPSSDVVPFLYQDSEDINIYGEAPVRSDLSGPDRDRYISDESSQVPPKTASSTKSGHSSKIHLPGHGHRHNRSSEDPRSLRPSISRENTDPNAQRPRERAPPAMPLLSKTNGTPRSKSPTPSATSNWSQAPLSGGSAGSSAPPTSPRQPPRQPIHLFTAANTAHAANKRGLLSRFRRHPKDKDETSNAAPLKHLPGSVKSLSANDPTIEGSPDSGRWISREGSIANNSELALPILRGDKIDPGRPLTQRQGTFPKLAFGRKPRGPRSHDEDSQPVAPATPKMPGLGGSIYDLDKDLSNMEGILSQPPPLTPLDNSIFAGNVEDEAKIEQEGGPGNWNAPDSWAVKKVDDVNMSRLPEIDDAGIPPKAEENAIPYCIRIFRGDGTFATLSMNLNATVGDVVSQLSRKTYMSDTLENYQIIMKKHDLRRILGAGERPMVIQKRLLEQAGYEERDRIEDIGREDNSYLCRFLFLPTRESGYAAITQDPGFGKVQKFSHVDLSGRNLITIPIALYSKATDIISLNLSRNLSLDLPTDFIQSCVNLRDIKYVNNEAWKLPPSLGRASRLTILDVSNNRLEQLEHAELDRLHGIISLKLANNRLTHLPPYFGAFRSMRTLNVSSNFIDTFPDFLCDLPALVDLDMSFNAIGTLPDSIGRLKSLERFVITNNRLVGSLPDNFKELANLKELDIRYNALSNIDIVSQLPMVEQVSADHNSISVFEGTFEKIRVLRLNSNPVTKFEILNLVPSLTTLILSNAKLAHIPDAAFDKMPNLVKLVLDKNHFVSLPNHIGKLRALEYFSIARNTLSSLPPEIGCLTELRFFDASQNNLKKLPMEIWWANKLETLNISSNVLGEFPKPGSRPPQVPGEVPGSAIERSSTNTPVQQQTSPSLSQSPSYEELGPLEAFGQRRPSQASGSLLSVASSPVPAGADRKNSVVSVYGKGGRKTSVVSRNSQSTLSPATPPPSSRKDSSLAARLSNTFAASLKHLYLADNQLDDDVFDEITLLGELRVLNLSYNDLNDLPQRSLRSWPQLVELYLSGNELTSLPSDDFEEFSLLQVLHINGNKFQTLPAELAKAHRLAVLDCGSNSLKYNVSNWPYDWNWNYNPGLKYLNLSGNKRLEIKPNVNVQYGQGTPIREERSLTNFGSLQNLRLLGLMDVTLTIPTIPDETEDRRVRTSGSLAGQLAYGMADTLGRNEHLSTIDMVVPRFNSSESQTLMGLFDGQALSSGGSKIAKYLHENFAHTFGEELRKLNPVLQETPSDALRRTFLSLNRDLALAAIQHSEDRSLLAHRGSAAPAVLSQADLNSGGVATVMYLDSMELYVANVGDAQAMLIHSEGGHRILTRKHDPAEPNERQRIRDAGGWVSRQGKLNDILEVSRAFGYVQLMPAVQAAPHITQVTLREQDEMVLIASRELWEYLSPELVVDVARSERGDLMRAAQRLRDLAMAFGATSKIMVMMMGVSDLKKRERNRLTRGTSMSMGPSLIDDVYLPSKRGKRGREAVEDSMLRRLEAEVQAPVGDISVVFTDIKSSTALWESHQSAMRSAIKLHNEIMRRQLRIIGGYEVKTEGDAFMVAFPTATSALLWCFSVQSQLLEVQWPSEILNHPAGKEVFDNDHNLIFRGISVRMGAHFGAPVCENDPVTRRMDYFGPMVNKTSRISSVADGGQIAVSADFITEIQRCLETFSESDRSGSTGSEDALDNDVLSQAIRRELRSLSSQGFEVKPMGERKLKGLENPEYIYLMYPHALAGRISHQPLLGVDLGNAGASKDKAGTKAEDGEEEDLKKIEHLAQLSIDPNTTWKLWRISLRLEMLCDSLEHLDGNMVKLKDPQYEILDRMKDRAKDVTDQFMIGLLTHIIARIEACVTSLAIRQIALQNPATTETTSFAQLAVPMKDVLDMLTLQRDELAKYKEKYGEIAAKET